MSKPSEFYWVSLKRRHWSPYGTGVNPQRKYNADHLEGMVGQAIEMRHPSIGYIARRSTNEIVWESTEYKIRKKLAHEMAAKLLPHA